LEQVFLHAVSITHRAAKRTLTLAVDLILSWSTSELSGDGKPRLLHLVQSLVF